MIWITTEAANMLKLVCCSSVTFDQCCSGAPWRNRTRIIGVHIQQIDALRMLCQGRGGVCVFLPSITLFCGVPTSLDCSRPVRRPTHQGSLSRQLVCSPVPPTSSTFFQAAFINQWILWRLKPNECFGRSGIFCEARAVLSSDATGPRTPAHSHTAAKSKT